MGLAVIIANTNFNDPKKEPSLGTNKDLKERLGTSKDIENLKSLFEQLNFRVEVHQQLSAEVCST